MFIIDVKQIHVSLNHRLNKLYCYFKAVCLYVSVLKQYNSHSLFFWLLFTDDIGMKTFDILSNNKWKCKGCHLCLWFIECLPQTCKLDILLILCLTPRNYICPSLKMNFFACSKTSSTVIFLSASYSFATKHILCIPCIHFHPGCF